MWTPQKGPGRRTSEAIAVTQLPKPASRRRLKGLIFASSARGKLILTRGRSGNPQEGPALSRAPPHLLLTPEISISLCARVPSPPSPYLNKCLKDTSKPSPWLSPSFFPTFFFFFLKKRRWNGKFLHDGWVIRLNLNSQFLYQICQLLPRQL